MRDGRFRRMVLESAINDLTVSDTKRHRAMERLHKDRILSMLDVCNVF